MVTNKPTLSQGPWFRTAMFDRLSRVAAVKAGRMTAR